MSRPRPRVFYGWWVVLTAALGLFLGAAPIVVFSFGVFFHSLSAEFHAGRAAISLAFGLHNLISALSGAVIGRLADRHGPRSVILPGAAILGLVLLSALALGAALWQLYLFYALLGAIAPAAGPIGYAPVVSRWFDRHRGLALGLMMLGLGLGAIAMPPVMQQLITRVGWRAAFALFGSAVLMIPLPIVFRFLTEDPKSKRLVPDGMPAPPGTGSAGVELGGLAWRETWHTRDFWLMTAAFSVVGASVQGCVLHLPALLSDRGMSAQAAANASAIAGVALLVGRTGCGYFLDRFFAPYVAMFIFAQVAIGLGLLWAGTTGQGALLGAFMVGIGMGAEVDLIAYLMSRYFGLRALGTAFGFGFGSFVLAGGLGVFLMGAGFDQTGSYRVPLAGFFVATIVAAILIMRLGPYRYGAPQVKIVSPHLAAAGEP